MTTAAVTAAVRSGASVMLSTAVTSTVSEGAVVASAGMTMVASEPTVNDPAAAATVSVVAATDPCESVAVTVATPPVSATDAGSSASVTPGAPSSSVVVTSTSRWLPPPGVARRACQVTVPSSMLSSTPVAVTVWAVFQSPVEKVSVEGDTAPSPASRLVTDTVTAAVGCDCSRTPNVAVPPASVAWPLTAPTFSAKSSSRMTSVEADIAT